MASPQTKERKKKERKKKEKKKKKVMWGVKQK